MMLPGLREWLCKAITGKWEVFAHLVVAAVFKTVGRHVNRTASGFDSHTLPPNGAMLWRVVKLQGHFMERANRTPLRDAWDDTAGYRQVGAQ